jgi:hypothetical protein
MSSSNALSSLTPSEQSSHSQSADRSSPASQGKVGKGIVHNGYIYGITDDSPLAAALNKLTDKKERYNFILEHGEKLSKVDFDTRCQRLQETAGPGIEASQ